METAINLGCHDIHITGLTNIDIDEKMKPDLLWDCTKLLDKFKPESLNFVYAGHFLEHISIEIGKKVVSDIFTILKQYGTFIAVVPDYSKCFNMGIDEAERIIMAENTHKILMNSKRLKTYFSEAGFKTIIEAKPDEIAYCPFPMVEWQTCIVGIKHPQVGFYGIK